MAIGQTALQYHGGRVPREESARPHSSDNILCRTRLQGNAARQRQSRRHARGPSGDGMHEGKIAR